MRDGRVRQREGASRIIMATRRGYQPLDDGVARTHSTGVPLPCSTFRRSTTERIQKGASTKTGVRRLANARLPTRIGTFEAVIFSDERDGTEPVALIHGDLGGVDAPLVRLHSECWTGDVLGSLR